MHDIFHAYLQLPYGIERLTISFISFETKPRIRTAWEDLNQSASRVLAISNGEAFPNLNYHLHFSFGVLFTEFTKECTASRNGKSVSIQQTIGNADLLSEKITRKHHKTYVNHSEVRLWFFKSCWHFINMMSNE